MDLETAYIKEARDSIKEEKLSSYLRKKLREELQGCLDGNLGKDCAGQETAKKFFARLNVVCDYFLPELAKVDILATKYQNIFIRASITVYVLAAVAVMIIAGQYVFALPHSLIFGEVFSMVIILAVIGYGNYRHWQKRWLDYRHLAEDLRCGIFLSFSSDHSSEKENSSLICSCWAGEWWCLSYFESFWENRPKLEPADVEHLEIIKSFLNKAWLENQKNHKQKRWVRKEKKHALLSRVGEVLYFLTLIAAILHLFHVGNLFLSKLWVFLAIAFPAAGSAFSALRAHFGFNKSVRRLKNMVRHINELQRRLSEVNNLDALKRLVFDIKALVVEENTERHVTGGCHQLETPA